MMSYNLAGREETNKRVSNFPFFFIPFYTKALVLIERKAELSCVRPLISREIPLYSRKKKKRRKFIYFEEFGEY